MDNWYVAVGKEKIGPLSAESLRRRFESGEFPTSSLVWRKGMEQWVRADQTPEFGRRRPSPASYYEPTRDALRHASGVIATGLWGMISAFFGSLFDFSFNRFIVIKLAKIIYGVFLFFLGIWTLVVMGEGVKVMFKGETMYGSMLVFGAPLVLIFLTLLFRVWLEFVIAIIKTAENTAQLNQSWKAIVEKKK